MQKACWLVWLQRNSPRVCSLHRDAEDPQPIQGHAAQTQAGLKVDLGAEPSQPTPAATEDA